MRSNREDCLFFGNREGKMEKEKQRQGDERRLILRDFSSRGDDFRFWAAAR